MYREPDKVKELRLRREELEAEEDRLEQEIKNLRIKLGMGTEQWRLWPTIRWTVPLILLGLGAVSHLMQWDGFAQLIKGIFGR